MLEHIPQWNSHANVIKTTASAPKKAKAITEAIDSDKTAKVFKRVIALGIALAFLEAVEQRESRASKHLCPDLASLKDDDQGATAQ